MVGLSHCNFSAAQGQQNKGMLGGSLGCTCKGGFLSCVAERKHPPQHRKSGHQTLKKTKIPGERGGGNEEVFEGKIEVFAAKFKGPFWLLC